MNLCVGEFVVCCKKPWSPYVEEGDVVLIREVVITKRAGLVYKCRGKFGRIFHVTPDYLRPRYCTRREILNEKKWKLGNYGVM
jgi:hypothetical protein